MSGGAVRAYKSLKLNLDRIEIGIDHVAICGGLELKLNLDRIEILLC